MNWKQIREANKPQDRYYKHYSNPESFWFTLDSKVVDWTYSIPLGVILRIIYSILGCSNRYEPMPIGNNPEIINLWKDKSDFTRYILWRIRNPFEDLRKFYLGFACANDVQSQQFTEHLKLWWAKFDFLSFRIPFPYYKRHFGNWRLMIGWKSRGIISISFNKR